jgi:hypothetical protein
MSNNWREARVLRTGSQNIKMWVVGDRGDKSGRLSARELKKNQELQGDAVVLDSNKNGTIDKDDEVLRVRNSSSLRVWADFFPKSRYEKSPKLRHEQFFGLPAYGMTLKELFTNLTGDGSVENNFHGFTLDKTPLKSFFENATPSSNPKKK